MLELLTFDGFESTQDLPFFVQAKAIPCTFSDLLAEEGLDMISEVANESGSKYDDICWDPNTVPELDAVFIKRDGSCVRLDFDLVSFYVSMSSCGLTLPRQDRKETTNQTFGDLC